MNKEEEIKELETKLMRLGLLGLAYTPMWNEITKKIKELKDE